MLPSRRHLPSHLVLALSAALLSGCTLALPLGAQLSEAPSISAEQARRYTVARPPRDGAPVLVILDDGSEVAGTWRGRGPGERILVDTQAGMETVEVARIVQIRGAARDNGRITGAFVFGVVVDMGVWFLATH